MSNPTLETGSVHRIMCHFDGRVQGVGFRYTAKNIAMRHNVTGYVRNLPDGRVELVMEGPDDELQSVVDAVKQRMCDFIKRAEATFVPATGEFPHFYIRH